MALVDRELRRRQQISQLARGSAIGDVTFQPRIEQAQPTMGFSKEDFSKAGAALQIAQASGIQTGLAGQVAGPAIAGGQLGGLPGARS